MFMNTSTFNKNKDPFEKLSNDWWDENSKFQSLHKFSDIRIKYINRVFSKYKKFNKTFGLNNIDCLDIGCGGGLLSERLARLGANVTGIDLTKTSIEVAKDHAKKSNLNINYLHTNMTSLIKKDSKKFKLIIASEVIEHVDDRTLFFSEVSKLLENKGILILTTINKTIQSLIFAKFLAENVLKILPKDIHEFDKFVNPNTLINEAKSSNIFLTDSIGFKPIIGFSEKLKPIIKYFRYSNNKNINYGISGIKIV